MAKFMRYNHDDDFYWFLHDDYFDSKRGIADELYALTPHKLWNDASFILSKEIRGIGPKGDTNIRKIMECYRDRCPFCGCGEPILSFYNFCPICGERKNYGKYL